MLLQTKIIHLLSVIVIKLLKQELFQHKRIAFTKAQLDECISLSTNYIQLLIKDLIYGKTNSTTK